MMTKNLAYVGLVVTDVDGTAVTLARDFGLSRTDCRVPGRSSTVAVFGIGRSALALFAATDPFLGGPSKPGIHHIAVEVPDLYAAPRAATDAGIAVLDTEPRPGLAGSRRLLLAPRATCGVRTYLSEPFPLERSRSDWVERIDHIGVASADNRAAVEAFVTRLGHPLESSQTDMEAKMTIESFTSDTYGVVYHARPPEPVGGLRVTFVTVGDCELEFLQDFDPRQGAQILHGQAGTTKQDQSAISKFIAARGPGLHHIALKVPDINAMLMKLERAGHLLIDRLGRPGSRRAQIGFLHPKTLNGVLAHLVEREDR